MAEGLANYTITTRSAMAEAQQSRIAIESQVFGSLREKLGLSPDLLVRYSQYGAMDDVPDASVVYGFAGRASVVLGSSHLR